MNKRSNRRHNFLRTKNTYALRYIWTRVTAIESKLGKVKVLKSYFKGENWSGEQEKKKFKFKNLKSHKLINKFSPIFFLL